MNESDLIPLLKASTDFARVSERSLGELVRAGTMVIPEDGSDIIRQGEASPQIWVLLEGELEVIIDGAPANRISRPGEVVGQISAVSLIPGSPTAEARITEKGSSLFGVYGITSALGGSILRP